MLPAQNIHAYDPPKHCVVLTRYFYPPSERPEILLRRQLEEAEHVIARIVIRPLQPHQHDALLCLVSDLVAGLSASSGIAFEKSFLVTALNKGMYQIAAAEFHAFCYADGRVQTRVWEKRRAESYLFSRGHLLFD